MMNADILTGSGRTATCLPLPQTMDVLLLRRSVSRTTSLDTATTPGYLTETATLQALGIEAEVGVNPQELAAATATTCITARITLAGHHTSKVDHLVEISAIDHHLHEVGDPQLNARNELIEHCTLWTISETGSCRVHLFGKASQQVMPGYPIAVHTKTALMGSPMKLLHASRHCLLHRLNFQHLALVFQRSVRQSPQSLRSSVLSRTQIRVMWTLSPKTRALSFL